MQALIENLLGEASLQAGKVGEAAVVVDDVVRTVRERGEQLERVVVREGLARLQTRDAASLQQVKSNLSVNHKGQGGTEGRGCGEALQVRRSRDTSRPYACPGYWMLLSSRRSAALLRDDRPA